MDDPASSTTDNTVEFRYRHPQFLAGLGATIGFLLIPGLVLLRLYPLAVACAVYGSYCLLARALIVHNLELLGLLSNIGILLTLLLTLSGVFFQTPEVILSHWIMTVPVIAYVLCSRKLATLWAAATVVGTWGAHLMAPDQLSSVSALMLCLALVAISVGMLAFTSNVKENEQLILRLGNTDALTDTLNRRSFNEVLTSEARRSRRQGLTLTVFMVDVDYFKAYNDRYGHVRGDEVLARVAGALKQCVRYPGDYVFRYGGEEFCVLCSGIDKTQAQLLAEQLRATVAALELPHEGAPLGIISVSVGYRHAEQLVAMTTAQLIEESDRALYLAKSLGRNRVETHTGSVAA